MRREPRFLRYLPCPVLILAGLGLASCGLTAEVFRSDIEMEKLELEQNLLLPTELRSVKRERTGVRVGFGESVRGYVQAYAETFDEDHDGYGGGAGIVGEPALVSFTEDLDLILPFRAGFNFSRVDNNTGLIPLDMVYGEARADLGIGLDIHGLQPSVGLALNSIAGVVDISNVLINEDLDLTGANAGGYINLQYKSPSSPLMANFRVMGGDLSGVSFSLGVSF